MSEIFEALKEASAMVGGLIKEGWNAAREASNISADYIARTFRFHFDSFAQYTMGKKFFKTRDNAELGYFGQILLTIFPITVTSWLLAGLVAPVFYNSYRTTRAWFIRAANLGLFDLTAAEQFKPYDSKVPWYRYIYGLPGLLVGLITGGIIATVIILGRSIENSILTWWHVFAQMTNAALEKPDKDRFFGKDNRTSFFQKYVLGLPGTIIGFGFGMVGFAVVGAYRVLGNSLLSAWHLFANITNIALYQSNKDQVFGKEERESGFQKYVLGFPGLIIGTMAGGFGFAIVGMGRIVGNSALTAWHLFANITNRALYQSNQEKTFGKDDRKAFFHRYILGMPGLVMGFIAGIIGFGVVGIGRIIGNTAITAWHVFATITDRVFEKPDKETRFGKDTRNNFFHQYILGFPGLILGPIAGAMGFCTIGFYRIVEDSTLTAWHLFANLTNRALYDSDQEKRFGKETRKSGFRRYVLGSPGLVLGTVTGIVGFAIVGFARIIGNSALTTRHVFAEITNAALEKPDKNGIFGKDERTKSLHKWVLGFPGIFFGGLSGMVGFLGVGSYRVIGNSAISAWHLFATMTNAALENSDQEKLFGKDTRTSSFQKYGLGSPGLVVGFIAGIFGFMGVGIANITQHSGLTAWYLFATMANAILDPSQHLSIEDARPDNWRKTILGFPGNLLGLIAGGLGFMIIGSYRVIGNSVLTTWHLFADITTNALDNGNKEQIFGQEERQSSYQPKKRSCTFPSSSKINRCSFSYLN